VVRDTELPTLAGQYVNGGYCDGHIRAQTLVLPDSVGDTDTGLLVPGLSSFGEDACGHVYAAGVTPKGSNNVFRLTQTDPPPPECVPTFQLPELTASVGQGDAFVISMNDPNGQPLDNGTLPEGSYTLDVSDPSRFHISTFSARTSRACQPRTARQPSAERATRRGRSTSRPGRSSTSATRIPGRCTGRSP
jgi:hypothetical protein